MSPRIRPVALLAILALLTILVLSPRLSRTAFGAQWLQNGGFEAGSSGWTVTAALGAGCSPRTGTGVFAIDVGSQYDAGQIVQNIAAGGATGTFRFSGYVRIAGGTVSSTIARLNLDSQLQQTPLVATSSWTHFSIELTSQAPITSIRVALAVTSNEAAVVCLDDFQLEDVPVVSPATITPTQPAVTATPLATASTVPTATPPLTATASPALTATLTATPTPVPLVFMNGEFENGTTGWRTHGLEGTTVPQPRLSGAAAGRFTSTTSSTKWAYQVVAIDPALAYDFSGHVMAEGGVQEVYLRISWYASSDGSGSAIHHDDSATKAVPGGFVALSTGSRTPPAGANSLRARVMVVPAGDAAASVYLDGFSLTAGSPIVPPPTVVPAVVVPDPEQDDNDVAPAPPAVTTAASAASAETTTEITAVSDAAPQAKATETVVALGTSATPAPMSPTRLVDSSEETKSDPPIPWPYLAAPATTAALAAGLILGRRRDG